MADAPASLPAPDAYRLWAGRYEETVVSTLEDRWVRSLTPPLANRALLDAGCGTGRRTPARSQGPHRAVGVDLVPEMLAAGRTQDVPVTALAAADVRSLPFRAGVFDLLWCRLVAGHLPELEGAYQELARVSRLGSSLIVSDFHPDAVAAGHARTFRDASGRLLTVDHHVHHSADHREAAGAGGWALDQAFDIVPGPEERPFYQRGGRAEQFERERALPLVLVLCFHR